MQLADLLSQIPVQLPWIDDRTMLSVAIRPAIAIHHYGDTIEKNRFLVREEIIRAAGGSRKRGVTEITWGTRSNELWLHGDLYPGYRAFNSLADYHLAISPLNINFSANALSLYTYDDVQAQLKRNKHENGCIIPNSFLTRPRRSVST